MAEERRGASFAWGPPDGRKGEGGVNTPPASPGARPNFEQRACNGTATYNEFSTNGCYKSECLSGDDQAADR